GGIAVTADQGAAASQAYFYSGGAFTSIPTTLLSHSEAAADINDKNEVVGSYLDSSGNSHGLYYNGATHAFYNVDYTPYSSDSYALAINNSSVILGAGSNITATNGGGGGAAPWIYSCGSSFDITPIVAAQSRSFCFYNHD